MCFTFHWWTRPISALAKTEQLSDEIPANIKFSDLFSPKIENSQTPMSESRNTDWNTGGMTFRGPAWLPDAAHPSGALPSRRLGETSATTKYKHVIFTVPIFNNNNNHHRLQLFQEAHTIHNDSGRQEGWLVCKAFPTSYFKIPENLTLRGRWGHSWEEFSSARDTKVTQIDDYIYENI